MGAATNAPQISIITATLNNRAKLARAIASVRQQSYRLVEHVIVDAMSTDGTEQLVREHQAQHEIPVVYIRERDSGMYEAINKGLHRATGAIVGILNSDDCYRPDTLMQVVEKFQASKAEVVYGNICSDGGARPGEWVGQIEGLNTHMSVPHPGVFVRADVYHRLGGFDESLKIAADYEFMLRMRNAGVLMVHINSVLCNFEKGGMSDRHRWQAARETFIVQRRHVGLWPAATIYLRRALEYSVISWAVMWRDRRRRNNKKKEG